MYREQPLVFDNQIFKKWQFLFQKKIIRVLLQSFLCLIKRKQLACYCVCYNAFYYQNLFFTQIYSKAFFTQIYSEAAKLASIIKHGTCSIKCHCLLYSFANSLLYDLDLIMRKCVIKPLILLKIISIDHSIDCTQNTSRFIRIYKSAAVACNWSEQQNYFRTLLPPFPMWIVTGTIKTWACERRTTANKQQTELKQYFLLFWQKNTILKWIISKQRKNFFPY